MNAILIRPCQPLRGVRLELYMKHAVHKRRGHGFYDRGILRPVSSSDHHAALGQMILANTLLVNQAVERLLHLLRARV